MYRFLLRIVILIAIITMAVTVAHADVIISISDLTDGFPIVTVTNLTGTVVVLSPEAALITGQINPGNTIGPIFVGSNSVILDEPTTDPFGPRLSDFITLTGGAVTGVGCLGGFGICQNITLLFESDGAAGFDRDVAALPGTTPHLLETGGFQDVTTLLGSTSNRIGISVASDLATLEPIPEPATLSLMGVGLAVLALIRKRVR